MPMIALHKSEEKLKSLLRRVKEESEKAGLKFSIKKTDHCIHSHYVIANKRGKKQKHDRFYFLGLQNQVWMMTAAMKLKVPCSWEGKL